MTSSKTKKTSKDGVTSVVIKRGKHGPMATGSTLPGQPQEGQRGNVILEGYFWHEKRKYIFTALFGDLKIIDYF